MVVGWLMGTRMDLNFQLFETATLFITVLVVAFMLQVGSQIKHIFGSGSIDAAPTFLIYFYAILAVIKYLSLPNIQ